MTNQSKAYVYGLISVGLWSTVATAFKLSLQHLDYAQLLLYSSAVSVVVLGGILAARGKLKAALRPTRREMLLSLGFGALNPFLYYLVLLQAYDLLPAQEAQPLNYTWAIALALLSIPLLKQKLSVADLAATFISYCGVVIIATRGAPLSMRFESSLGVGLALVSTVIWALYWILNTRDTREPVAGLFLNFLLSLPLTLAYTCLFSDPLDVDLPGLLGAAYVGTFEMGLTFVCWLTALKLSTNTAKVGNLIFISPFLSLVFIHYLLGEVILPSTFVGLACIIAGLIIQRMGRLRRQ